MKGPTSVPEHEVRPMWLAAVAVTVAAVVAIGASAIVTGALSLHASILVSTIVGNAGVGFVAMRAFRVPVPTGDFSARHALLGLAIGVAAGAAGMGLTSLIQDLLLEFFVGTATGDVLREIAQSRAASYERLLLLDQPQMIPLIVLVVAVAPGISEEFLFRGVIHDLVRRSPLWLRMVGICCLFGLIHFDVFGMIPLVFVGALFVYLRERCGGWGVAALAHIAFNALNAVVLPRVFDVESTLAINVSVSILLVGGLATGVLLTLLPARVGIVD